MESPPMSIPAFAVNPMPVVSSMSIPCAACKYLRRKCQDCPFAPYFPPNHKEKFMHCHKIYGASNVAKLLKNLEPEQRHDAVKSLVYEAEMRLRDPIHGCTGVISILQRQLLEIQNHLYRAKLELAQKQQTAAAAGGFGGFTNMNSHQVDIGGYVYQNPNLMEMQLMAEQGTSSAYDDRMVAGNNVSCIGPLSSQFVKSSPISGGENQGIGPP